MIGFEKKEGEMLKQFLCIVCGEWLKKEKKEKRPAFSLLTLFFLK